MYFFWKLQGRAQTREGMNEMDCLTVESGSDRLPPERLQRPIYAIVYRRGTKILIDTAAVAWKSRIGYLFLYPMSRQLYLGLFSFELWFLVYW